MVNPHMSAADQVALWTDGTTSLRFVVDFCVEQGYDRVEVIEEWCNLRDSGGYDVRYTRSSHTTEKGEEFTLEDPVLYHLTDK